MVIARYDQKGDNDQFAALNITSNLYLKEMKLLPQGNYSLV